MTIPHTKPIQGRIYISGAFTSVKRSECGDSTDWLDNDPHFWTQPPTWGICRTDLRRVIEVDDFVFFVLPRASPLPQMIYGYFRVCEKITHMAAYFRHNLHSKRMRNKIPNGNIIVDAELRYNRFDGGRHRNRFERIKNYYIVGDEAESEFLAEQKIRRLAPAFLGILNDIFGTQKDSVLGTIGRGGRRMSKEQVSHLLMWLKD
jgi:hypothetical protein